jgi:hypothetical protein
MYVSYTAIIVYGTVSDKAPVNGCCPGRMTILRNIAGSVALFKNVYGISGLTAGWQFVITEAEKSLQSELELTASLFNINSVCTSPAESTTISTILFTFESFSLYTMTSAPCVCKAMGTRKISCTRFLLR